MSSYQVNADLLFDSDSSANSADDPTPAIRPPSPKRLRTSSAPTHLSSTFTTPSSTALPPAPRTSSFPTFTAAAPLRPSSFPSFTATLNGAPTPPVRPATKKRPYAELAPPAPQPAPQPAPVPAPDHRPRPYGPALGPAGRGRAATLPAHVTASRPAHPTPGRPAPAVQPGYAHEQALNEAAEILPEHLRERYLKEARKKADAHAAAERKRPGRRRKDARPHAQGVDAKKRATVSGRVNSAKKAKPAFSLGSLLAVAGKKDAGLIKLDPDRTRGLAKVKRPEAVNVYKAVSRTKESVEREERLAREEKLRKEEEARQTREFYEDLREREREERRRLADKWRRQKTVAGEMRDSHFVARIEKHLFAGEDKQRADNLDYLGLRLRPVADDEHVSKLLTIEVIHI